MSSGSPDKPTSLDEVYAEAYRSYLRSLRDGLANLDIDALDLTGIGAPLHPIAVYTAGRFTHSGIAPGIFTHSGADPGVFTHRGVTPDVSPAAGSVPETPGTPLPSDDKNS